MRKTKKSKRVLIILTSKDRLGGCQISANMKYFLDWINSNSLFDLRLNGGSFTWSNNQDPPSIVRLDRFFISGDWADLYPYAFQTALPKPTLDHCLVFLDLIRTCSF